MTAPATLTTSYCSLVNIIAQTFYNNMLPKTTDVITDLVAGRDQARRILNSIQKGLQSVYYPPDGYVWSFMRPIVNVNTIAAYNTGLIIVDSFGNVVLSGGSFPTYAASSNGQIAINAPQPPEFNSGIWQIASLNQFTPTTYLTLSNYQGPLQPLSLASGTNGSVNALPGLTFTWGTPTTATVGQYVIVYNAGDTDGNPGAYLITAVNGTTSVTLSTSPAANSAGVVWSLSDSAGVQYNLTFNHYTLPTGFDSFQEDLTEPTTGQFRCNRLEKVDELEIRQLLQYDFTTSRPRKYAITTSYLTDTSSPTAPPVSTKYLTFWPCPGAVHSFYAKATLRPTMLDSTNAYPIGDEVLAHVITEACLAAAEREIAMIDGANKEGIHGREFPRLLAEAVLQDKMRAAPDSLGVDHGYGNDRYGDGRYPRGSAIYLNIGGLAEWIA